MLDYGLVLLGLGLFTILAITMIEAGGRHRQR